METEYEARILDIDIKDIRKRLEKIGAKKIAERNMRRYVYEIALDKNTRCGKWIRLRDDGEKITLTVKNICNKEINGTQEIETEVKDFEKTDKLILAMGFSHHAYQENKRISYKLGDVSLEIDTWPKVPPFLEIEGLSADSVNKTVELLGFEPKDATSIGVTDVFYKYGLDINQYKELKF